VGCLSRGLSSAWDREPKIKVVKTKTHEFNVAHLHDASYQTRSAAGQRPMQPRVQPNGENTVRILRKMVDI